MHSSDDFSAILGTSIVSIMVNNREEEICFYIIEDNISNYNKNLLNTLVKEYGQQIVFIPMPDINKRYQLGLKKVNKKWFFNSYCRLFLYDLLPLDVHRVIYLDSDTITNGNLKELWNTNLEGCAFGAVYDCLNDNYYKLLSLNPNYGYCNSGVLLQDLDLLRQINALERIKEYINNQDGYVFFMEQTILNSCFYEYIKVLSPKYNFQTLMASLCYDNIIRLRQPKHFYSKDELNISLDETKIIHLTTAFFIDNRAWYVKTNHPAHDLFIKYQAITPWDISKKYIDDRGIVKKILSLFLKILPKIITFPIVRFIYNNLRVKRIEKILRSKHKNEC